MMGDCICALSTATGGALNVVRISGAKAIDIVDKCYRGINGRQLADAKTHTIHYGTIHNDQGEAIDDVVAAVFRAPKSYTGEDTVELTCHGSAYITGELLRELIRCGCRQAEPGEYTRRAFMNGKMDLSQAEAVADLIASTNRATHRMAMSQLRGNFSSELSKLRDQLLHLTTLLELELDFSDHEDLEFADRQELWQLVEQIDQRVTQLAHSFEAGNALKNGIPVAIVGKTNVGKSTLLNRLLHDDRAIVSSIHGTTRDTIEDTIDIQGVTFRFIDTAGLRQTDDEIEQLGIERTYKKIDQASIIIWLTDTPPTKEEAAEAEKLAEGKTLIRVRNKSDLQTPTDSSDADLLLSAKFGQGVAELESALIAASSLPEIQENDVVIPNARHYAALCHAHDSLERVKAAMSASLSADLISEDLRDCLQHLASITGGEITTDEVLSNIFSHFCVGK